MAALVGNWPGRSTRIITADPGLQEELPKSVSDCTAHRRRPAHARRCQRVCCRRRRRFGHCCSKLRDGSTALSVAGSGAFYRRFADRRVPLALPGPQRARSGSGWRESGCGLRQDHTDRRQPSASTTTLGRAQDCSSARSPGEHAQLPVRTRGTGLVRIIRRAATQIDQIDFGDPNIGWLLADGKPKIAAAASPRCHMDLHSGHQAASIRTRCRSDRVTASSSSIASAVRLENIRLNFPPSVDFIDVADPIRRLEELA